VKLALAVWFAWRMDHRFVGITMKHTVEFSTGSHSLISCVGPVDMILTVACKTATDKRWGCFEAASFEFPVDVGGRSPAPDPLENRRNSPERAFSGLHLCDQSHPL
jgi:hypothetical protein